MRLQRWTEGRAVVDRLLADKKLDRVAASEDVAELLLVAAAKHIESAALIAEADPSGSCQLSYDGARKSLAAVLQIQGLRPTSSGGHYVIEECLKAQLVKYGREIVDKFSVMRRTRNSSEYPQSTKDLVAPEEALEQVEDARDVMAKSTKLVEVMPVYGK